MKNPQAATADCSLVLLSCKTKLWAYKLSNTIRGVGHQNGGALGRCPFCPALPPALVPTSVTGKLSDTAIIEYRSISVAPSIGFTVVRGILMY